jgi:hypothetical protein
MQHIFSDVTEFLKFTYMNLRLQIVQILQIKTTIFTSSKIKNKAVKCDVGIDCLNYIQLLYTKNFTFFSFCFGKYHTNSTIHALYELGGYHSNKYYDYSLVQHYAVMLSGRNLLPLSSGQEIPPLNCYLSIILHS